MEKKMKLDADEHILLTEEDIERIKEICANPPKPTEYMIAAVERYKERYDNETKDQSA